MPAQLPTSRLASAGRFRKSDGRAKAKGAESVFVGNQRAAGSPSIAADEVLGQVEGVFCRAGVGAEVREETVF